MCCVCFYINCHCCTPHTLCNMIYIGHPLTYRSFKKASVSGCAVCTRMYVAIPAYVYLYHSHCGVLCIIYIYMHVWHTYTYLHMYGTFTDLMVSLCTLLAPAFNVYLELQGHCSDQLTLICRHSDVPTDPNWVHNGTAESGQLIDTAFPGAVYSVQSNTEHRVTISGVGNVQTLDGYIIQCVYSALGNLIKSNAVKYSFIPSGQCMCCIQGMSSCPICVHMSMSSTRICVQPSMYRMHALCIVELALTSHSRLCGIEVVREILSVTSHTVHHTRDVQIATSIM